MIPEDLQVVLPAVCIHRLAGGDTAGRLDHDEIATLILAAVPVP